MVVLVFYLYDLEDRRSQTSPSHADGQLTKKQIYKGAPLIWPKSGGYPYILDRRASGRKMAEYNAILGTFQ